MFQDSSSLLINQFIQFHDRALIILTLVVTLVIYWLLSIYINKMSNRYFTQHQTVEIIWTISPIILVIMIVLPSVQLLYLLDTNREPAITLKVTGNQWYWTYSYSDFPDLELDSYIISQTSDRAAPRLLDTDNRLPLPINTPLRLLVTASDVIHAWTVPALGVKADAVPGRLNLIMRRVSRPGLLSGQCSEICGANHRFMPVTIERVSSKFFIGLL